MIYKWLERNGLKDSLINLGIDLVAFILLTQGMLTDRYLDGFVLQDSRVCQEKSLVNNMLSDSALEKIRVLNHMATSKKQSLAHMAIARILHDNKTISALFVASKSKQETDCLSTLYN